MFSNRQFNKFKNVNLDEKSSDSHWEHGREVRELIDVIKSIDASKFQDALQVAKKKRVRGKEIIPENIRNDNVLCKLAQFFSGDGEYKPGSFKFLVAEELGLAYHGLDEILNTLPNNQKQFELLLNNNKLNIYDVFDILEKGANVNILREDGTGLLHHLISQVSHNPDKTQEVCSWIEKLVEKYHADIHIRMKAQWNRGNLTPLEQVIDINNKNTLITCLICLIKLGAGIDAQGNSVMKQLKNKEGHSFIHIIIDCIKHTKDENERNELIKMMVMVIEKNPEMLQMKDEKNRTPFERIITGKIYLQAAWELLRLGANINTKNKYGRTFLDILERDVLKKKSRYKDNDKLIVELKEKYHPIVTLEDFSDSENKVYTGEYSYHKISTLSNLMRQSLGEISPTAEFKPSKRPNSI